MEQKLIKRKLNMGIIISAVVLLLATFLGGIGDIVEFIREVVNLSRTYSLFEFRGIFSLIDSLIFPFFTFLANLIFVFYIFKGYCNGKKLLGAIPFLLLILSKIVGFFYGLLATFIYGSFGGNSVLQYIWLFISSLVAVICYAAVAFSIFKSNRIILIGSTCLLCFGPLLSLIYNLIIYIGVYKMPLNFAIRNLGIFDFFLTGIMALSFLAFAIFAFSKKDEIQEEVPEETSVAEEV